MDLLGFADSGGNLGLLWEHQIGQCRADLSRILYVNEKDDGDDDDKDYCIGDTRWVGGLMR